MQKLKKFTDRSDGSVWTYESLMAASGLDYHTVKARVRGGWSRETIIRTPKGHSADHVGPPLNGTPYRKIRKHRINKADRRDEAAAEVAPGISIKSALTGKW